MGCFKKHIGTILQIFKRDWTRLLKNPVAIVIIIGVCFLPALYAWYIIAANWDPYQNTDNIKVAIANNDEGAYTNISGKLDIGQEVVDDLKENHSLDWQFTDSTEALELVESGDCYAALIIPSDFSQDFANAFEGNFKRPVIEYYVNEKLSGSAVEVTNTGAQTVEDAINKQFVDSVSDRLIEISQRAGAGLVDKTNSADDSLAYTVKESKEALDGCLTSVSEMSAAFDEAKTAVSDSSSALENASTDAVSLESDLQHASNTLKELRSDVATFSSDAMSAISKASVAIGNAAAYAGSAAGSASAAIEKSKGSVDAALSAAQSALRTNQQILSILKAEPQTGALSTEIARLESENSDLEKTISELSDVSNEFDTAATSAAASIESISDTVEEATKSLQSVAEKISSEDIPELESALDDLSDALGSLRGALIAATPEIDDVRSSLKALDELLSQSDEASSGIISSLESAEEQLEYTLTDLNALRDSAAFKHLTDYIKVSPDEIGEFLASPVELKTETIYPIKNYGTGVAPFFTNIALWVAGFILMAILKIRVDPAGLPEFSAIDAYFGRWLTYIVVSIVQGLIVSIGDLIIGIQCVHPAAFIGASLLTGIVYTNLMFGLAYSLRHIGKAIAVILLIMQIPGSSGMFPVQMLPAFFQGLHPLLPFTYSIDAMREAIGGFYGFHYLQDMLVLVLAFFPLGLLIGLLIGRYGYNINVLFDWKLRQTDLFVAEAGTGPKKRFRTNKTLATIRNTPEFKILAQKRALVFDRLYPKLARIGWISIISMPILMMVVLGFFQGSADAKLTMLAWFILLLVIVCAYLIVLLYIESLIKRHLFITDSGTGVPVDTSSKDDRSTNYGSTDDRSTNAGSTSNASVSDVSDAPYNNDPTNNTSATNAQEGDADA